MDNVLEEAVQLRESGFAIHWLRSKSKAPFENDWARSPVKTVEELRRTFKQGYNLGFRPGKYSRVKAGHVVVLDIDVRGGAEFVAEAYAAAKTLTGTDQFSVKSGSGFGRHNYYVCAADDVPQKAATTLRESDVAVDGKPAWKIELLSTGKNVVLPPSVHPDTNQPYEWLCKEWLPVPKAVLDRLAEAEGKASWPEPEDVRTSLLPVPKFSSSLLPAALAPWINDAASRMQCPADFIAGPTVVIASILIGTRCGVRPKQKDDWLVTPNLWGAIVGSPGMLKSPAFKIAMAPIEELERRAKDEFESARSHYLMEKLSRELERKAVTKEIEGRLKSTKGGAGMFTSDPKLAALRERFAALTDPTEPTWRRFKTNDPTVEKIIELEAVNRTGLLVFRDELVGLLAALDREDRPGDRAFYLEAWAGDQSYTSDRIGRGTVHAERNCLSVLGGIQPSRLAAYLHDIVENYANDGLLQRFQVLLYPDEPRNWRLIDRKPNQEAAARAHKLLAKLANVDFDALGAEGAPLKKPGSAATTATAGSRLHQRYFHFSAEAQQFFNAWLTELETTKIRGEQSELMVQHLAKYRSLMPSIALILHVLDLIDTGQKGPISLAAAEQAAAWCAYLEHHARRVYALAGGRAQEAARALATKIRSGALGDAFSERDVYRKCWLGLTDTELVARACRELESCGWIRKVHQPRGPSGGRPASTTYEVNPKLIARQRHRGH